jgi:hypothetical protein
MKETRKIMMNKAMIVTALFAVLGLTKVEAATTFDRAIEFSGYDWYVKDSNGVRVGPGPNRFSDAPENVWVDEQGRLHLKITRTKNVYRCAEVVSALSFGYGTYRWYLDSPVDALDPNMVLGLFTWSNTSPYANGEIDIEFSRWSKAGSPNSQFVVQPYADPGHRWRFSLPAGALQTTHSFTWRPMDVFFESLLGHPPEPVDPGLILQQYLFQEAWPTPTDENARINLWLYRGASPAAGAELEVIIRAFEFVPLP